MAKNNNIHPTRIFKDEADMQRAWDDYKLDVIEQSKEWLKIQYVGKDGERVAEPTKVPYTFEGFKRFCYKQYGNIEQYFINKNDLYANFVSICSRIKDEIRENQIIGGLMGFYNPSITQRLNNLTEKTDITTNGEAVKQIFKIGDKEIEL